MPGGGDVGTETVDGQQAKREEDAVAEVGNLEDVSDFLEHRCFLGARGDRRRPQGLNAPDQFSGKMDTANAVPLTIQKWMSKWARALAAAAAAALRL